ncbi:ubiquitin carboxyl-terminal hydrolase isozyme L5 [Galendromus occidentalis]|uniref:Ubiquitin carboxyl-terminal hydrolase n=1 Tax=Galendromus occidentalis TaxID=34638 RepID=A0AAJ6QNQ0_9ACAR|nr:ubiquitin carboxyl-terminal hydrolase isozyme L5 [Galendromus occidentalis]
MSAGDWCLIESDPGVFSELIRGFGVSGVQVEEIFSLEDESFVDMRPVFGLIFLFKYTDKSLATSGKVVTNPDIFFAKQVINNACATQAILAVLMNLQNPDVNLGENLAQLKEFTKEFDSQMKGLTFSNSDVIREVHNSFSRPQIVEFDQKASKQDDDVYHFISYVPINGKLYELDGLREGPIEHCEIPANKDWLESARQVIEQRIAQYSKSEIHFNLMAVVKDRRLVCQRQIEEFQKMGDGKPTETVRRGIARLQKVIKDENAKIAMYQKENIRRRHNYIPLIMELLKITAESGKLGVFWENAKSRQAEQAKKAEKRKASAMK